MPPRLPFVCRPAVLRYAKFRHHRSITFDNAGVTTSGKTDFKPFDASLSLNSSCSNRFANRSVLISSGGHPIGKAIAKRFLQEGAAKVVMIWEQTTSKRTAVVATLKEELEYEKAPIIAMSKSIKELEDFHSWPDDQQANLHCDVLVNCKESTYNDLFTDTDLKRMEVVVDRSLMSTLILSKAFVKMHLHPKAISATGPPGLSFVQPLERTSSPCIINISSIMANKGSVAASAVVYATSKAGLIGFTKALAAECSYMMTIGRTENRIRVNALLTGYIEHVRVPGLRQKNLDKMIPMGRLGTADEVADAALFLATNEYANNCVLNLDGGLSAMRKWYLRKLLLIQTDVACHNRLMNLRQIPGLHHQD